MSDDAPKSAYEIALEKLKRRDRERGETAPTALTDKQKKVIADIRKVFEARLAEREILYRSERAGLLSQPEGEEKLEKIEEEYVKDRQRIEAQRERAIQAARAAGPRIPRKKRAGPKAKMLVAALGLGFLASGHHLAAPAVGKAAAQETARPIPHRTVRAVTAARTALLHGFTTLRAARPAYLTASKIPANSFSGSAPGWDAMRVISRPSTFTIIVGMELMFRPCHGPGAWVNPFGTP